jgi:hypothetical protein
VPSGNSVLRQHPVIADNGNTTWHWRLNATFANSALERLEGIQRGKRGAAFLRLDQMDKAVVVEPQRTPSGFAAFSSSNTAAISPAFWSAASGLVLYLINVRFIALSIAPCGGIVGASAHRRLGSRKGFDQRKRIRAGSIPWPLGPTHP